MAEAVIKLAKQTVPVVSCDDCKHLMVNLDLKELAKGDLTMLKKSGVRISNPNTDKPICVNCEFVTLGARVAKWFEEEDDDDSSFFAASTGFLGGSTFGSSGRSSGSSSSFGGFGGFGGGGFSGGGASGSF